LGFKRRNGEERRSVTGEKKNNNKLKGKKEEMVCYKMKRHTKQR